MPPYKQGSYVHVFQLQVNILTGQLLMSLCMRVDVVYIAMSSLLKGLFLFSLAMIGLCIVIFSNKSELCVHRCELSSEGGTFVFPYLGVFVL